MATENKLNKRIAIDARFLGEAGPGRYVKNILNQLEALDVKNEYFVFLRARGFEQYTPVNPNFKKILADYKWYSWKEQISFLFKIIECKADLLYVPHFNIPVLYTGNLVTAIPDIIMHHFSTERGTTLPKLYFKFKKLVYKVVVWCAVKKSYKIIVPSKDVIEDFLRAYPKTSRNKFILAYEGVDPSFTAEVSDSDKMFSEFGIRPPYLLYISSMYEHKNVPFLLDMFKEFLKSSGNDYQLVLIGKKDKFSERIAELVKQKGLEKNVIMPGMTRYVKDSEITALRKNASLYVFPSLKEGFSLTPLEAQAVGLSCLISDIPCHREIYGDSVLYFDPHDMCDAVEKMKIVLNDANLRHLLVEEGYENVKKYDWRKTGEITLAVFNDLLKNL